MSRFMRSHIQNYAQILYENRQTSTILLNVEVDECNADSEKPKKNSTIKKYNKIAHKVALVSSLKFPQRIYCVVPVACECSQYNILSPIFPHGALGNKQRRGKRVQTGDSTPPLNLQYFLIVYLHENTVRALLLLINS